MDNKIIKKELPEGEAVLKEFRKQYDDEEDKYDGEDDSTFSAYLANMLTESTVWYFWWD